MRKDKLKNFYGKDCKIITRDNFEEKTHTISGVISDFDSDDGSLAVNTKRGRFYLKIDNILSIKFRERFGGGGEIVWVLFGD